MDIVLLFHLLLIVIFYSIPFWPIKYLQYGIYIPLTITIVWIIFGGCPLSKMHNINNNNGEFSLDILRIIYPNANPKLASHVNTFSLVLITLLSVKKLNKFKIETN